MCVFVIPKKKINFKSIKTDTELIQTKLAQINTKLYCNLDTSQVLKFETVSQTHKEEKLLRHALFFSKQRI